jgi:hypothetical protein
MEADARAPFNTNSCSLHIHTASKEQRATINKVNLWRAPRKQSRQLGGLAKRTENILWPPDSAVLWSDTWELN